MNDGHGTDCIPDDETVAALYARHAVRVRNLVRLDVSAPEAVIEDACQVAWMRLVGRRAHVQHDAVVRWVIQVARREVWRQAARTERERSLSEVVQLSPGSTPDLMEDVIARRSRVEVIRALPARQRRLVWLQGLGFSYEEMAGATGDSRRTVERQLLRARNTMRRLEDAA